jgi:hypothetical protein
VAVALSATADEDDFIGPRLESVSSRRLGMLLMSPVL